MKWNIIEKLCDDLQCIPEVELHGKNWIGWMKFAFACCFVLSVTAIIVIVLACLPKKQPIRLARVCCICFALIFELVCAIGLTYIRFGAGSSFTIEVGIDVHDIGRFLEMAVIINWCLCCLLCFILFASIKTPPT